MSVEDIIKITKAVFFSSICFIATVVFFFNLITFPRSVFIIDTLFIFLFLCSIRFSARLFRESLIIKKGYKKNILIMGAGSAGLAVVNELRNNPDLHLNPVGFIDDNTAKKGFKIKGVEVLGTRADIPQIVSAHAIDEVLISMPSAPYQELHEIFKICDIASVKYRALPRMSDIIIGKTIFSQFRDVDPDELLGRPSIAFRRESDKLSLHNEIGNKCIIVTGAGGSIGSELCRQIAVFKPTIMILYERNENNLYFVDLELRKKFPHIHIISSIGDILNKEKLKKIVQQYNPDVIYHAAAYKHVPLMEKEPLEALRNNVMGTKTIADVCVENGIKKFIFISTDKAVNPSSIMGTTKRMTEKLLQTYQDGPTKFISVRFGNVVGSSGSVIPVFKKQIADGGPITITHPEATRFLMTIPEAVQLVLLAGSMGAGGEIFLLDMGEPVKIVDLASNLIELSGLVPYKDINIEFIGLRDGEKLHEELYWEGEHIAYTANKKIRKLTNTRFDIQLYKNQIAQLELAFSNSADNEDNLQELMQQMVPEATIFQSQKNHAAAVH